MYLFSGFRDQMVNAVREKKQKLVCRNRVYFFLGGGEVGWRITERLNSVQILSLYFCFFGG